MADKTAEIRAKVEARIAEFDAKFRRVNLTNVVLLDCDSMCGFHESVTDIIKRHPTGAYEVQCVVWIEEDDLVENTDDEDEYGIVLEALNQVAKASGFVPDDYGWVIPEDDPLYDEDNMAIVFSADHPDEDDE